MLEKGSPSTTIPFLKWRLAFVEDLLKFRAWQKIALDEANEFFKKTGKSKTELMAAVLKSEKELRSEKSMLLSQGKSFEGDLHDVDTSKTQLEAAYTTELRISLELASSNKQRGPGLNAPRLERKQFAEIVHKYLGTENREPDGPAFKFCNVLGIWMTELIKCAHIIPFSFDTKELGHMFGSDEAPLTSRRNCLSLQTKIEEAFDDCWITIVPLDSVASTPTEWKVVILNPAIKDNVFYRQTTAPFTKATEWRWRDIDGRKLTFLNDNRPARRFLYMRYTLAWLHAENKKWVGFKEKVPPGEVWASPNKPDGYLRKSILLELGKMTGDKLPRDLMEAGAFENSETDNAVYDAIAGIRVTEAVEGHLDGVRDPKRGEDSEDSEEEDD